eukprot:Nitzschia sp. Nitz4//scaffold129_size63868//3768//7463//NITZ4_006193-RA/size63868-augustus-gene-0.50-mRNA-1//1//CDS//3329534887//9025//frame0
MKQQNSFIRPNVILDDNPNNLFVRLSPDLLTHLVATAAATLNAPLSDRPGWTLSLEESEVSFLPLELLVGGESGLFGSFNGGLLETSCTNTIQIPRALLAQNTELPSSAWKDIHIQIRALPHVAPAVQVFVDPVDTTDWELLEVHAGEFEGGSLLRQVSVVSLQQTVRLRMQNDVVHFVVQDIRTSRNDSLWPVQGDTEEHSKVALLLNDSELVINPKPRIVSKTGEWSEALRLIPCSEDLSEGGKQMVSFLGSNPIDVLPGCLLVSEDVWDSNFGSWARMCIDGAEDRNTLVRVATSSSIAKNSAVLHPWLRLQFELSLFWGHIRICPVPIPIPTTVSDASAAVVTLMTPETKEYWRVPNLRNLVLNQPTPGANLVAGSQFAYGSLVATPSCNFLRLKKSDPQADAEDMVVSLSSADVDALEGACHDNTDSAVLFHSATDGLQQLVPSPMLSCSLDFAKSLSKTFEPNGNNVVTLCGPTGSGKTHISMTLASIVRQSESRATLYIDCKQLREASTTMVQILAEFDAIFDHAVEAGQCCLILDDMDSLAPGLLGGGEGDQGAKVQTANPTEIDQAKLIADRILQLKEASNKTADVKIIVTCASPTSLHQAIVGDQTVHNIPVLNAEQRLDLLGQMIEQDSTNSLIVDDALLGEDTEGFRPRDLEKIASRVRHASAFSNSSIQLHETIRNALKDFSPVSHLGLDRSQSKDALEWSEVGGLFEVKRKLENTLMHPTRYRSIYQQAKVRLPRGVLLFGPTGCGKSAIVPALAKACKFSLVSCKGPEILDKYIGASEAKVRELFKQAAAVSPSILFLDELDALAPRRGSDHTGVTDRVVNQLLTFLDGVEDTSHSIVYIIGATSRPDKVDAALLRPGRLEQHLYVGPPESPEEWVDLVQKLSKGWSLSERCRNRLSNLEGALDILGTTVQSELFCPADMKASLDTAHLKAVHRLLRTPPAGEVESVDIDVAELQAALQETKPCLGAEDGRSLSEIYDRYRSKKKGKGSSSASPKLKTTLR